MMDLGLQDKVAIVTGGSRGIGKGIARGLIAEGCNVVICGRTEETLQQTKQAFQDLPGTILPLVADVTKRQDIDHLITTASATFDKIDILVNNVGGNRRNPVADTSEEDWQDIIDLNLMSHVNVTRAVLPVMKKQKSGSIIFISSIFGREMGGKGLAIYNTTKSAVISFAKVLALESAAEGIRVNSVAPGSIRFPGGSWDKRCLADPEGMAEFIKQTLPIGRFGTVEEIANVVVFLASERAGLVTGACINVDGCQSHSLI
jgi:3-oxoacyl-[acyl-carrier protein] reductase